LNINVIFICYNLSELLKGGRNHPGPLNAPLATEGSGDSLKGPPTSMDPKAQATPKKTKQQNSLNERAG